MLPNFDKETVREALDSANGSLGRAAEALLVGSGKSQYLLPCKLIILLYLVVLQQSTLVEV